MQQSVVKYLWENSSLRYYCIILIVCLIGYWPLTTGLFSLKNDALQFFLPFRYQISCSIREGNIPFWSPYLYNGFPIHGDLQASVWNPFVWLLSLFGTYDATLFHIEYLIYLFLAGSGMYKLCGLISRQPAIRLFCAFAYILCGYMTDSGQFINWIASSAFIPFALYAYSQLLNTAKWKYAAFTAVFLWLLLVCGYTADIIYMSYILLAMMIFGIVNLKKNKTPVFSRKYIILHFLIVLIFLGLAAPALLSFEQIRPFYLRGNGISFEQAALNKYELKNYVSLLSPWTVSTPDYISATNVTGRNIFVGIISVCFGFISLFVRQTRISIFLIFVLVFSFLFSLGDVFPLRRLAYELLPGMNFFRHPSHFRLYIIIPFLLLGGKGLSALSNNDIKANKLIPILYVLLITIFALTAITLFSNKGTIFPNIKDLHKGDLAKSLFSLKSATLLFWGLILQSLFCAALLFILYKGDFSLKKILYLHLLNLLLFQSVLPMTFFGRTSAKKINQLIHNAGKSDPATDQPLLSNSINAFDYYFYTGIHTFYEKKPSLVKKVINPSGLASHREFLKNDSLYQEVGNRPISYLLDTNNNIIGITTAEIGWNKIVIKTAAESPGWLYLTQNYSPNWSALVDNAGKSKIEQTQITFMRVWVEKGQHQVTFSYNSTEINICFLISAVFITLFIALLFLSIMKQFPKKEKKSLTDHFTGLSC